MSIQPNELRIGNLVAYNGQSVYVDVDLLASMPSEEHKMSGISLTDEWLERLGFQIGEVLNDDGDETSFWFIRKPNGQNFYLERDFQPTDVGFPMVDYRVEYVHQLQNLFYAICGEELTIKQPA